MKRIISLLAVMAIMAAMVAVSAMPAFAEASGNANVVGREASDNNQPFQDLPPGFGGKATANGAKEGGLGQMASGRF